MRKIRQGNDFTFVWAVKRNGVPEDFGRATDIRLALRSRYGTIVINNHRMQNEVITIDFTPPFFYRETFDNILQYLNRSILM